MDTMTRVKVLANHIKRTVTGPMWHGPALAQALEQVTHDRAAARPIAGAHSIWEIVLHITVWSDIARARLKGERIGDPTPEEDWPPVTGTSLEDWRLGIEALSLSHRLLATDVRDLEDAALDEKVRDLDYTVGMMLHGVIEHGTYHSGQIVLLCKVSDTLQLDTTGEV